MNLTLLTILGLIVGVELAGAGTYYLIKEKNNRETMKIYRVLVLAGIVITVGTVAMAING